MEQSKPAQVESTEKLTWDYDECAKRVGVNRRTISRMVHARKIPFFRANGRVLFRPESILQWMKDSEQQPDNS